jgi:uncharacterized repeat protein (TIGR03803 family)
VSRNSRCRAAADLTPLVNFNLTDGVAPYTGLILDANGNLFGTTYEGGIYLNGNGGTVFEIVKTAGGYASTPTTLVSFNGTNGQQPLAGLIADADGNLFGTTWAGGAGSNGGTVFEIAKTATGYASNPTTLISFCAKPNCTDGVGPLAGLIADADGNLFGTTYGGGAYGWGTVFEIVKTATGYASTPTILVSFNLTNGAQPFAGLIADADGNLFGTTQEGGAFGVCNDHLCGNGVGGTVFEIVKTAGGYATTPTTLVNFSGNNGSLPSGGLIADASGNLFGTTLVGGAYGGPFGEGNGTVFEIVKTATGYASTPTTLVSFNGTNGYWPRAGLIVDANGNLFGTTQKGGAYDLGTAFEIVKTAGGYASTPTTLVSFNGTNGSQPYAVLVADASGNLFGTTSVGGNLSCNAGGGIPAYFGCGTVFQITGSGFVPPVIFAGTPGNANCRGKSVSALAQKYGDLDAAAAALGYSSVSVLQDDIAAYCAG